MITHPKANSHFQNPQYCNSTGGVLLSDGDSGGNGSGERGCRGCFLVQGFCSSASSPVAAPAFKDPKEVRGGGGDFDVIFQSHWCDH